MTERWHNWSGSVTAQPGRLAAPRSEDELAAVVREARQLRAVGAGHSFMPLCATDGTLVTLADLEGTVELAPDGRTAWAPAGWSLRRVAAALWELGRSLPNQGDVDPQSLAGALATGTHGTGAELGCLSSFARGFRLMQADGSIAECSADAEPELFEAQRLSLGLLGVATRIRIAVEPAYRLEQRIRRIRLPEAIEQFAELARRHRHAEFFVFPYANEVILKTLHPTDDPRPARAAPARSRDSERSFRWLCELCHALPFALPALQRLAMTTIGESRVVGPAHQIFPSERTVRFEEMEYELPRADGLAVLGEVIRWIRARRLPVIFPFEFRWTAADDIWLSPFNRGPCASISMHQYVKRPWQVLFRDAEPILRGAAGRPHWAKRHSLTARDVFALYPRAREFCAVRRAVDPEGKFANPQLAQLFEAER